MEGPEAHKQADYLSRNIAGRRITKIRLFDYFETAVAASKMRDSLKQLGRIVEQHPVQILNVFCKGKVIFIKLQISCDRPHVMYLINSPKRYGSWCDNVCSDDSATTDQMQLSLERCDDGPDKMYYRDGRCCNLMLATNSETLDFLPKIGPDIAHTSFTCDVLADLLRRQMALGILLVTQTIVSGIGQYMRSEILYRAQILPDRSAGSLEFSDITRLYSAIKHVFNLHYRSGKMTVDQTLFKVHRKKIDAKCRQVIKQKIGDNNVYFVMK